MLFVKLVHVQAKAAVAKLTVDQKVALGTGKLAYYLSYRFLTVSARCAMAEGTLRWEHPGCVYN